jgi:DNA-binding FrmR family transcriptional regulator
MRDPKVKSDLLRRLKRIEGQSRGVQRMVEEERDCTEILGQLSALNEAIRSVGVILVEKYALECLHDSGARPKAKSRAAIANMLDAYQRLPR